MHPAWSVVFLTTLIGAGQGLFIALYAGEIAGRVDAVRIAPGAPLFVAGAAVALVLGGLGLVASVFHLGRPERAWRAAARWRTSWLSREVVALPLFMAGVAAYGVAHWRGGEGALALGAAALVACLALFVCTAMIYACIRFLQEWASPLTFVNFFLLGCASGATLAAALAGYLARDLAAPYAVAALALTVAGLASRAASLRRNARLRPRSSLQTAIGIRNPRIAQKAQGFMGGSFNTREFFHGRTPSAMRAVKWTFLVLTFALPAALLVAGVLLHATVPLVAAVVVQYAGLLAERWFFLAQANHPQNLYYQSIA